MTHPYSAYVDDFLLQHNVEATSDTFILQPSEIHGALLHFPITGFCISFVIVPYHCIEGNHYSYFIIVYFIIESNINKKNPNRQPLNSIFFLIQSPIACLLEYVHCGSLPNDLMIYLYTLWFIIKNGFLVFFLVVKKIESVCFSCFCFSWHFSLVLRIGLFDMSIKVNTDFRWIEL